MRRRVLFPCIPLSALFLSRTVFPVPGINTGGERWRRNPFANQGETEKKGGLFPGYSPLFSPDLEQVLTTFFNFMLLKALRDGDLPNSETGDYSRA